jgi:GT2 family glycosyltransferase
MIETWAVIPTRGRPDDVRAALKSLDGQIAGVVLVDNNDDPEIYADVDLELPQLIVTHRPGQPPNLSALINAGIELAEKAALEHAPGEPFNIAFLNDDVEVPEGWVESVATAMRSTPAVLAYVDRISRSEQTLYIDRPATQWDSMTGWACMIRGELGLRWDESLQWWYADTDLDWRCRELGGVLAVPGPHPIHKHPSAQTFASFELSAQAHVDEQTFNAKWAGR